MCHYKLKPFKNGKRFKISTSEIVFNRSNHQGNWWYVNTSNGKIRKTFDLEDIARNYANGFQFVLVWRSLKKILTTLLILIICPHET